MPKEIIETSAAPAAVGPYAQAVKVGPLLFVSGQIAIDPETGNPPTGGTTKQTERCVENLKAVLEASGAGIEHVTKVTVYLVDLDDFKFMNQVFEKHFGESLPARSTVEVSKLPKGAKVEIDAIAVIG